MTNKFSQITENQFACVFFKNCNEGLNFSTHYKTYSPAFKIFYIKYKNWGIYSNIKLVYDTMSEFNFVSINFNMTESI